MVSKQPTTQIAIADLLRSYLIKKYNFNDEQGIIYPTNLSLDEPPW